MGIKKMFKKVKEKVKLVRLNLLATRKRVLQNELALLIAEYKHPTNSNNPSKLVDMHTQIIKLKTAIAKIDGKIKK
ncbi:MAG: hypothetical protein PHQ98_03710 [Candidatus ainarchaeum sp.]|nr:hypothetical protein [Candidatus ainarchaeum sp.]